jgi:hypothetical protein
MKIPGRNVAAEAAAHQSGGGGYTSDEDWVPIMLEAGFRVWRGIGGKYSPYHIGPNYMGAAGAIPGPDFWQSAQVRAHRTMGYRPGLREYEVLCETVAAHGTATDNWSLGWGGAEQYFIPEDCEDNLSPTGNVHYF